MMDGLEMIAAGRQRQIEKEGWSPELDDAWTAGQLAQAAECYLQPYNNIATAVPRAWPWAGEYWKPRGRLDNLVRAGALMAAERDRLKRRMAKIASEIDRLLAERAAPSARLPEDRMD